LVARGNHTNEKNPIDLLAQSKPKDFRKPPRGKRSLKKPRKKTKFHLSSIGGGEEHLKSP